MELPIMLDYKSPKSNLNDKMAISGTIMVSEKIIGPIDVSLDSSRCTLDMQICAKYTTINIREVCKKIIDKNSLHSNLLANIKPPLKCPIMPGNYTIEETEFNLAFFAFAPIDGYVYITNVKIVALDKETKARKVVCCFKSETKIVKIRVKS
jgi:hypothetical protein